MKDTGLIIRRVLVTEKGSTLSETQNKYFFEVDPRATKIEVKKAVEDAYKVKVAKVNTQNLLGKRKRERTFKYGKKSDWKKAVVTLKEGNKIELT